jgi:acetyl-CoA carboxylase carboxyl transferase subunit beta
MTHFAKPRLPSAKAGTSKKKTKVVTEGLWTKCPVSGEIVFNKDLEANQMVVPKSGYHFPIGCRERIQGMVDAGTFVEFDAQVKSADPLKFVDSAAYPDRIKRYEKESGLAEAVLCGTAKIDGIPVSLAVMDFRFLGASMGSGGGRKNHPRHRGRHRRAQARHRLLRLRRRPHARGHFQPHADGQDQRRPRPARRGPPALHLRAHAPDHRRRHRQLRHPRRHHHRRAKCMIGFAGPRVVKETTHADLPPGFQTAEFMMQHGLVDRRPWRPTESRWVGRSGPLRRPGPVCPQACHP